MDRRRLLSLLATAGCGLATGCDDGGAEVAFHGAQILTG